MTAVRGIRLTRTGTDRPTYGSAYGLGMPGWTFSPLSSTLTGRRRGVPRCKKAAETVIFPRYHQWDAVRALEADANIKGAGQNYLVQHSAWS